MKTVIAAAIVAASLAIPASAPASAPASLAVSASAPADTVFPRGLPYAPNENECYTFRCVWDAKHQGNGKGQSLILTRYKGDYIAKRITHRRAHRLHAAYCKRKNVNCEGYDD